MWDVEPSLEWEPSQISSWKVLSPTVVKWAWHWECIQCTARPFGRMSNANLKMACKFANKNSLKRNQGHIESTVIWVRSTSKQWPARFQGVPIAATGLRSLHLPLSLFELGKLDVKPQAGFLHVRTRCKWYFFLETPDCQSHFRNNYI